MAESLMTEEHHHHHNGEEHCSCKSCQEVAELMEHSHSHEHTSLPKWKLVLYFLAVLCFGIAFLPMPELASTLLYGACILLAGYELLWNGLKCIVRLRFEEDALMTIAAVAAFVLGEHPEACMVVLLFQIGEFLEEVAINRSRKNLKAVSEIRPDTARLIGSDESVQTVPAELVQVGDSIQIRPGDKIPLDCIVLDGHSAIDTSALTGESVPMTAEPGDTLLSGGINTSGLLTCQVTKTFENSTASQIVELVYSSAQKKGRTEKFITKFSKYYTPIVLICGIFLAFVPPLLGSLDFKTWIMRSLVFLVASCPCALVISVPLSFFSAIGAISKQGVLVKGTKYVETLAKVDCVAMDKTGTLTSGKMTVEQIDVQPGFQKEDVYAYAHALEQSSTHPISQAICAYTQGYRPVSPEKVEELAGFGVIAVIDGKQVLCGSQKLLHKFQIAPDKQAASYLCISGKVAARITLKEEIPEENRSIARQLKQIGVQRTVMLTGDSETAAKQIASLCQVDEYHASLLPKDKVDQVEELKKKYRTVAFLGDGINDAPVLASAHLGISMGLGSEIANSSSDVVLMGNQLSNLPKAISLAKRSMRVVWSNIIFALLVKLVVIVLVAVGVAPMWLGIFADTGVTMLAILNSVHIFSFVKRTKKNTALPS